MSDDRRAPGPSAPPLAEQIQALRRLALAATRPAGPEIYQGLVAEVSRALGVALAMVAVFADETRVTMRTLAAVVHGHPVPPVHYPLAQSPCVEVVGKGYCFMPGGVLSGYATDPMVVQFGLDAYAAFPMSDSRGEPLGLVAVLDMHPIAGGDTDHAEAVLKIAAVRLAGELERTAANEALRRSADSYRAIFEAAEDSILVHDWETFRLVDVNERAVQSLGYAREQLLAFDVAELMSGEPPHDLAQVLAQLQRARHGACPPFEWPLRLNGGAMCWHEMRLKPVTIDNRPCILAFARDISDRKAAESRLRDSEEQYRAIFNASADALILWDEQYRRVDVNDAYERIYGWTRAEVVGSGFEVFSRDSAHVDPRRELVRRALAGESCRAELEGIARNGRHVVTEIQTVPFRHRGQPHVLAIARDITERKRSEVALRAREELHRALFEGSVDAMVLYDESMHMVDCNATFADIRGQRREALIGHHWSKRRDADEFSELVPLVERALQGHEASTLKTVTHADGTPLDMELRYLPVRVGDERFALGIGRDITQRRAAEAERAALEAQLRQAQKMEAIGQLTGGIAHDFNNILTSVIGYIVLGQERAERHGDATLVRQLGSAHTAAQRARELIAQMLAFARRQRGDRRVLTLAPLVRQAMLLLRPSLSASIALDDLGLDAVEAPAVRADAVQLEQVLFNLCINARDAMPRGGRIAVRLREARPGPWCCASCGAALAPGRWVELAVSDNGSGIDSQVLPRMFEPFFTTKEVGRGTGMGLAMVHGIVHDHEGHIVVESEPGRGSLFRVLLPATADGVDPDPAVRRASAASAPLHGRVMLVEDEPLVAEFMHELLEGWGLDVLIPTDARAAAAWFDDPAHEVDLLLTDLTMPLMNGLDLAHHVSVMRPGLPVLLYSGHAEGVDGDALRRAGVRARLDKPVDPQRLKGLLRESLPSA